MRFSLWQVRRDGTRQPGGNGIRTRTRRRCGGGAVVADGTSITVVRGDDYLNTDGRALTFTGATWPTLTAGTVALIVDTSGTPTSYSGVITAATSCYVELTTAQTTALSARRTYDYDLQATLSNGSIVTLVQGTLLVVEDIR